MIAETLSHYRVIRELGRGGMGVVCEAKDIQLGRKVALKFLPHEVSSRPEMLERFKQEARAASSLNHPNICTIYEIGQDGAQHYIAMELLEGQPLDQRIGRRPLDLKEILDFGIQIADALDAAHSKGILHRDIKPGNIFITHRGQAKILDFGLAKITLRQPEGEASTIVTTPGVAVGTPAYMSPEQVLGKELDARSDLFSFGVVLYEMATGVIPFRGDTSGVISDSILHNDPPAPVRLNPAVPPELEQLIAKALEKDCTLRYQHASEIRTDLARIRRASESGLRIEISSAPAKSRRKGLWLALAVVVVIVASVSGWWLMRSRRHVQLSEKDTILIADFENKTGDSVFDDTLKQGLTIGLQQTPYLNIVTDQRVAETLQMMGRKPDERISGGTAREVCQRLGSKAVLAGSISGLGGGFVLGLKAVNCVTGETLVSEQEQAKDKEGVLGALDKVASGMRAKLGESLATLEKFDVPLEQATTSSLDALKAYRLGQRRWSRNFFERAVELDPNFALAYIPISKRFFAEGELELAKVNAKKAYELRTRVSERERLAIDANYHKIVTGDLSKAEYAYHTWIQTFPRDAQPQIELSWACSQTGDIDCAIRAAREGVRLDPKNAESHLALVISLIASGRLSEVEAAMHEQRKAVGFDHPSALYFVAFLKGNTAELEKLVTQPGGPVYWLLYFHANAEARRGRLNSARDLMQRVTQISLQKKQKELAGIYQSIVWLFEAEFGMPQRARANALKVSMIGESQGVQRIAAVTLARTGDIAGAERIAAGLSENYPQDTLIQGYYLPMIRALIELQRKNAARAIELLSAAVPFDLSVDASPQCPAYVRGEAYLMLKDGTAAAAEFRKIIDNPGIFVMDPVTALARLGLARAYVLSGDTAKARAAYQDFLTLWKDADPDIPVLLQAKAEFAALI